MSSDELHVRMASLEELTRILVQLARNHDTRMDDLSETMNNLAERVTVLVDAQIMTEERLQRAESAIERLAETQKELAEAQKELADSQQHTDERLNVLIDIVSQGRSGDPQ